MNKYSIFITDKKCISKPNFKNYVENLIEEQPKPFNIIFDRDNSKYFSQPRLLKDNSYEIKYLDLLNKINIELGNIAIEELLLNEVNLEVDKKLFQKQFNILNELRDLILSDSDLLKQVEDIGLHKYVEEKLLKN